MKPWTRTRTAVAAGSAAGVLAIGAVVPALAQDADTDTDTGTDPGDEVTSYEARLAEFAHRLADKLGLDAEEVTTALEEVVEEHRSEFDAERRAFFEDRLDEAVADGDLTREQADALLDALETGVLPFGGRHGGFGDRGMRGFGPGGGRGFGPGFGFGAGSGRYESSSTDADADPASV